MTLNVSRSLDAFKLNNFTRREGSGESVARLFIERDIDLLFLFKYVLTPLHLIALEAPSMLAKSLQSRPTLCDPMDCGPPSSSVHEIL